MARSIPNHWGPYEETRTQGLALAFAAILAGLFTYAWCATFADRLTAMLAAIIYLTLPYSLTIDLYLRAAIGEFWALSFLPLSFYFIERMAAGSRRAMPGLAVAFALVILSHLFTAVLLAPVLLAYAVWRVPRARRLLSACQVLAAFLLATGLAGVYALPFLAQRRFFHPENFLLTQGANASPLSQMFSFNAHTFPGTWRRPGWLHMVMAARLIALATAAFIAVVLFRSRRKRPQWLRLVVGLRCDCGPGARRSGWAARISHRGSFRGPAAFAVSNGAARGDFSLQLPDVRGSIGVLLVNSKFPRQ